MFTYRMDQNAELRLLDLADAKDIFELVQSNRGHLRHWLSWVDGTKSVADSRVFIESTKKQLAEGNGFQAGIWYKAELAGIVGFHGVNHANRKAEIGYWLGESFQGKGLMTKACRALIEHAFTHWDLNKVIIRCGDHNRRSCAIPERLGFKKEGLLRDEEFVNDRFVSHHFYGMLKTEWSKSKTLYELESARKELFASIEGLSDHQLNTKFGDGIWTIAQVLEHLSLTERWITEKLKVLLEDDSMAPASKKIAIEGMLDRSYPVKAPTSLQPSDEQMAGRKLIEQAKATRSNLLELIGQIKSWSILENKSMKHQVFGDMDLAQWVEIIGLHERRHLMQIEELKAKL